MYRLLLIFLSLFTSITPAFCYYDDSEDEYDSYYDDDDDFSASDEPRPISYGGITIECFWNCGDEDEDANMYKIRSIAEKTVSTISKGAFPLWIGSDLLIGFEAWDIDGSGELSAFDWAQTGGFLLEETPCQTYSYRTYPEFLELAAALRRDVEFYFSDLHRLQLNLYKSTLSRLNEERKRGEYGAVLYGEREEPEFFDLGMVGGDIVSIKDSIRSIKHEIASRESLETEVSKQKSYEKKKALVEKAIHKMDQLYRDIFVWCLENHQPEGVAFKTAVEDLIAGEFEEAIEKIRWLLELAEQHNLSKDLFAKLHLLQGQMESESALYAEAVVNLTKAIQKDPSLKEAYFERAAAYFELGQFDQAIEDFIRSGKRSTRWDHPTQWGLGIAAGIVEGGCQSMVDFVPSLFHLFKDVANGLWAFGQNPRGASQELVHGAQGCLEYLRSQSLPALVEDLVPELKSLLQNYDQLSDFDRGQMVGLIIGKYGTDIFFAKYATKAAKSYYELKKANQLLTLEALTSPNTAQEVLRAAARREALRAEVLKSGNLKIHQGRQAKHIEGHVNYEELCKKGDHPSIFEHANPDRLVQKYAGTGRIVKGDIPGVPGCQEVVNFEEFIGYVVDERGTTRTATTWGKIHYSKDGVHIVPYHSPILRP